MIRRLKKWICVVCLSFTALASYVAGSSLIFTKNTSALKHYINTIPLYAQQYLVTPESGSPYFVDVSSGSGLRLGFPSGSVPAFDLSKTLAPIRFTSRYGNGNCYYDHSLSTYNLGHWTVSDGVFTPGVISSFDVSNSANTFSYCSRLSEFGQDGRLEFDSYTLRPGVFNSYNAEKISHTLKSTLPYGFDFSALVLRGTSNIDGIDYDSHGFTFDELLGSDNVHLIESPNLFEFPIGTLRDIQSDDFVDVVSGTSLEFSFSILAETSNGLDLSDFDSSTAVLNWAGADFVHPLSSTRGSVTCEKSYSRTGDDIFGANIDFVCNFISPYDFPGNYLDFTFSWSSSTSLFVADDLYLFSIESGQETYVITDGVSTPGSSIGATNTGSAPNLSPGSPIPDPDNANWFTSLLNTFNFNLSNPFAPIFGLFQDNSGCYNIPTIAGMLHAESSQYCPWFDSSTRNLLTPVFGLASSMLLFGFIVRWLNSESGNMSFEHGSGGNK